MLNGILRVKLPVCLGTYHSWQQHQVNVQIHGPDTKRTGGGGLWYYPLHLQGAGLDVVA